MVRRIAMVDAVFGLLILLMLPACGGKKESKEAPGDQAAEIPTEFLPRQTDVKLIGLAYINAFQNKQGMPLKGIEDLAYERHREKELTKSLEDGVYVVIYGVDLNKPESKGTIIVYERDADARGKRFVALSDGEVKYLSEKEFSAMPRAKGS
jgi:hypothetical protein